MNGVSNNYVAIIDDDESVCRSLGRLLRMVGYQPVTYHYAEDFLADRNRPHFASLVLDVQLGGISGLELRKRLAAVGDTTPVIFITAHDSPETRAEAVGCGCAGYFRKTDPGDAILEAIRGAVGPTAHKLTNHHQES